MLCEGELLGGDFQIVRRLGGGGMGAVYLAHQLSTDSLRAVKIMRPEWTSYEELVRRFELEARACGRIQSDHVVKILSYGVDVERQMPWLVMEYLPGETLEQRVQRLGVPTRAELVQVLEQLFHGVAAAHRAGIVHRDLKPQNIYVADAQRPGVPFTIKVLDFGIAKWLDGSRAWTRAMGTKAWMAPEQERAETVITPAADVWALGLITFWLMTGRPFWLNATGNDSDLSYEVFFQDIPPATERALQLGTAVPPRAFDAWFFHCVTRQPERRFTTAQASWVALCQVLGGSQDRAASNAANATTAAATQTEAEQLPAANAPPTLREPDFRTTAPSVRGADRAAPEENPRPTRRRWLLGASAIPLLVLGALTLFRGNWLQKQSQTANELPIVYPASPHQHQDASTAVPPTAHPIPTEAPHDVPAGMVFVAAGQFLMGMDDGKKRHRLHSVVLTRSFFIDRLEVSVLQYAECVGAGRCTPNSLHGRLLDSQTRARLEPLCNLHRDESRLQHPINCVDRAQAEAYCAYRNKRLPTEAEWEFAARGSDGRAHPWGNDAPASCGMTVIPGLCGQPGTRPVGSRDADSASPVGALDMSGNVWEWVQDAWNEGSYAQGTVEDPLVRSPSAQGTLRGGSWDFAPQHGHIAYRLPFNHHDGNVGAGFRCARDY